MEFVEKGACVFMKLFKLLFLCFLTINISGYAQGIDLCTYPYQQFLDHYPYFQDSMDSAIAHIAGEGHIKEEIEFSELSGGMTTAKLFTFVIDNNKYILRSLKDHHPMKTRGNEITAQKFASTIGIAPEVTFVDKEMKFMVMPYIEGHILTQKDLLDHRVVESLGIMLSELHCYEGAFDQLKPQIYRTKKHFERAVKKGVALPSQYHSLYKNYIQQGHMLSDQEQVLCHADLNPSNIIVGNDNKIYLIDWTSSTWDNKYTDLGYFSFVNGLDDEQSKRLICSYLGRDVTQDEWQKLKNAQKRTSFLTATVWFDFSESAQEKNIPMDDRVAHLDKMLQDPNFKTGQEYIKRNEIVSPLTGETQSIKLYALGFFKTYITW
jgi:thiamine kinase-like enzyme